MTINMPKIISVINKYVLILRFEIIDNIKNFNN